MKLEIRNPELEQCATGHQFLLSMLECALKGLARHIRRKYIYSTCAVHVVLPAMHIMHMQCEKGKRNNNLK